MSPRPRACSSCVEPRAPARGSRAGCRRACTFSTSGPARGLRRRRRARREHRQLAVERHELLRGSAARRRARPTPRSSVGRCAQHDLALAVVAAAARLQHRRQPDRARRGVELAAVVDGGEARRRRCRARSNVSFSVEPVLRDLERAPAPGAPAAAARQRAPRGGHAFPLVGDDVGAARRPRRAPARRRARRRRAGRTRCAGASGDGSRKRQVERRGRDAGEAEHPAELAAAEHGDVERPVAH